MNRFHLSVFLTAILLTSVALGCSDKAKTDGASTDSNAGKADGATNGSVAKADGDAKADGAPKSDIKSDKGVDVAKKTIKIALLNDESGPAASIGKPFAVGKRILAKQVNAGGSGLLPEGWKIELIEKDHGYNPQKSVQSYNQVEKDVLFIGHSFGTPNTLPLRPMLARDKTVAFPASLSSEMAKDAQTPPAGPSYAVEAMRAMDWLVEKEGDVKKIKAAIVYQQDDYGKDGLGGWEEAAKHHGVEIVAKQTVAPGQKDYTAVVTELKGKGATHVLLTTLPSTTGPILGTAATLKYTPLWIGNTPSWVDRFFDEKVLPPAVLANFHWVTGLPFWGEEGVKGMKAFTDAYEKHGKDLSEPDFYILISYVQGLVALEAAKRAIESKDITRAGYLTALKSIKDYTANDLVQPMSYNHLPYVTGTKTHVLKPALDKKSWTKVADYADPKAIVEVP